MSFYFSSTSQHADTNYTWLERRFADVCGLTVKPEDIENLNVQYFNEDILKILFQMYAILHGEYFPCEIMRYMVVNLHNPTIFEPIFHIVDDNEDIVHIFHVEQIRTYFNYNRNFDIKQLQSHSQYLLEPKNTQENFKFNDTTELPAVIFNRLQTQNLIKLYVLCDHAIEHRLYYHNNGRDDKNFDKKHTHFGTDTRFLSAIISQVPKRSINELTYDTSMDIIENSFGIKHGVHNDNDDDTNNSDEENINMFINAL